jgi:hypothetical protein
MKVTKTRIVDGLFAASCLLWLASCSSVPPSQSGNTSASISTNGQSNDDFLPPVNGETEAQVQARYDDPDQVFQTSEGGETWIYVFGKGKLYIPFYGPFAQLQYLTIHFDQNGRVRSWESGTNRSY